MKKTLPILSLCLWLAACNMPVSPEAQLAADNLTQKGYALLEAQHPKDALPYFDQAIAKDSNYVRAYQGKGIALNKMGKNTEAETTYQSALSIDKNNIGVINNLGLSHIFRGDYEGAIALLEPHSHAEPVHAKVIENLALAYCLKGDEEKASKLYKTRLPAAKINDNLKFCKQFRKGRD